MWQQGGEGVQKEYSPASFSTSTMASTYFFLPCLPLSVSLSQRKQPEAWILQQPACRGKRKLGRRCVRFCWGRDFVHAHTEQGPYLQTLLSGEGWGRRGCRRTTKCVCVCVWDAMGLWLSWKRKKQREKQTLESGGCTALKYYTTNMQNHLLYLYFSNL